MSAVPVLNDPSAGSHPPYGGASAMEKQSVRKGVTSLLLGLSVTAGVASAQTDISGNVFDGSGGPLLSGQVYHATGVVTIPTSETLTVQPGAIIKFNSGTRFLVNGDLDVQGSAGSEVHFTSIEDDSVGGDSNGNGASVGAPGDWQGIQILSTSTGTEIDHAVIRFFGQSGFDGVDATTGSLTLRDSTIEDGSQDGVDLNNNAGTFVVERNVVRDNTGYAIDAVHIDNLDGFLDNVATGNGLGDVVRVTSGTMSRSQVLGPRNGIDDTVFADALITIPAGLSLELGSGSIWKFGSGTRFLVNGDLIGSGSAGDEVVLTTEVDDAFGGDLLNDGPTTGTPGDWQGVQVLTTSAGTELRHTRIRFAGQSGFDAVDVTATSLVMTDSIVEDCSQDAVDLNGLVGSFTLERNDLRDSGGYAIDGVHVASLPGLLDNQGTGNASGDTVRVTSGTLTQDLVVGPRNGIDETIYSAALITIPSGLTLTLEADTKWKFASGTRFLANGDLVTSGTAEQRVVITSIEDDEFGGDTLNDGPTTGTPGDWQGVQVLVTSTATKLEHTRIRFAGQSGFDAVDSTATSLTLRNCVLEECSQDALDTNNVSGTFTIELNTLRDTGGYAVDNVHVDSVPGFRFNRASGNALGDYMRVAAGVATRDTEICRENLIGGVLVAASILQNAAGDTLTFRPGVVVKWTSGTRLLPVGEILIQGSGAEPVIFTSIEDDSVLGDTNLDGNATTPAPNDWQGVDLVFAENADVDHLLVRYAGQSGFDGVRASADTLTGRTAALNAVRAEFCGVDGFDLTNIDGDVTNLVAFGNLGDGISVSGGFDIVHATAVGNAGIGLERISGTAQVRSSITWGNTASPSLGFGSGDFFDSNGNALAAGSNGNIFADPLFVDELGGDLRLTAGSPCVDAADTATALALQLDHVENSRLLDPNLAGVLLADMGAYEYGLWTATLDGPGVVGGRLRHVIQGPAGTSAHYVGLLDGATLIPGFGFLATGVGTSTLLGTSSVGATFVVDVPRDSALVGAEVGLQTLTAPLADPTVGNATQLIRVKLRGFEAIAPQTSSL